MHDPTEGGVATGLYEMARGAKLGAEIDYHALPFLDDGKAFCKAMNLDPLGAFASGSLLITVANEDVSKQLGALRESKLTAAKVGLLTDEPNNITMTRDGKASPITPFDQDEFARLFD